MDPLATPGILNPDHNTDKAYNSHSLAIDNNFNDYTVYYTCNVGSFVGCISHLGIFTFD